MHIVLASKRDEPAMRPGAWRSFDAMSAGGPSKEWLLELARALQTTLSVEQLMDIFPQEVSGVLPFDGFQYQSEADDLQIRWGIPAPHTCTYRLRVMETGLGSVTYSRGEAFRERETEDLELVTSHLVYPLRNALLYQEALRAASRDPLTGLNNRANLQSTLEREVELARRHKVPLSVIMADLDHFKAINDHYGHARGDCALRAFAEHLQRTVRASDVLFRYGGEEFLMVLRNTTLAGATLLAERVRAALQDVTVQCDGASLTVTASLGVSGLDGDDDADALLRKADRALYQSKAGGRNRVTAAA